MDFAADEVVWIMKWMPLAALSSVSRRLTSSPSEALEPMAYDSASAEDNARIVWAREKNVITVPMKAMMPLEVDSRVDLTFAQSEST